MFCPNCGTKLPEGARFCPECGCRTADYFAGQTPDADNDLYDHPQTDTDRQTYRDDQRGWNGQSGRNYQNSRNGQSSRNYQNNWNSQNSQNDWDGQNSRNSQNDWDSRNSRNYRYDQTDEQQNNYQYGDTDEDLYEDGSQDAVSMDDGFSDGYEEAPAARTSGKGGIIAAAVFLGAVLIAGGIFLYSRLSADSPQGGSPSAMGSPSGNETEGGSPSSGILGGLFGKKEESEETDAGSTAASSEASSDEAEQTSVPLQASPVKALKRPSLYANVTISADEVIPAVPLYQTDSNLDNIVNLDAFYLNDWQKRTLFENGFCVWMDGWDEYYEVYENNRYQTLANFVTVDSMMHTYHLYFMHLMKNLERDQLFYSLSDLTLKMQERSISQLDALKGTEWESAAKRNTAFFSIAAALLDDGAVIPGEVSDMVGTELERIYAASEIQPSTLAENYMEDYSQYTVRGYYEGDPVLERYFRAMMWYGRMNFTQKDEDLDRSALLITMALDDETLPTWESIYTITSFFAGASDDCGYYEYKPILDEAYGAGAAAGDLPGNTEAWEYYHSMTAQMDPPEINSMVFLDDETSEGHEEEAKGYRFMGQRFSIDAAILQQLIYSHVGENSEGNKRMLPDALDVPAALGSDAALSILEQRGNTGYAGYSENLQAARDSLAGADDSIWYASLYSQWLHTLRPLLEKKGEGWPVFMQSDAWTRKNLQSFLGSYTELKHDTVLYSKQVMAEMGGGPMETYDDRGYVEPEPAVFRRLETLTQATRTGLAGYGLLSSDDDYNLSLLQELASSLAVIAEKELKNEVPTDSEFDLIRTYGGQLEHFWQEVYRNDAESGGLELDTRNFPAAIVTDIATDPNGQIKELGTGRASTIYVIVPVDGTLRIASGSVFSFYQFAQPLSDRLTDTTWRQMMGFQVNSDGRYNEPAVSPEDWTTDFQRSWRDEYP